MQPQRYSYAFLASDFDGVALAQTPGGAGNLTLNGTMVSGGVATFTYARFIGIDCAADETDRTFTVYGTDWRGVSISEAITGADQNVAVGTTYFKTVTRIATTGAGSGNVTAGPSFKGAWQPVPLDTWANPFHVTNYITSSNFGDLAVTLQSTADDVLRAAADASINWTDVLAGATSNSIAPLVKASSEIPIVATAVRLISGGDGGAATVNLAVLQAGGGRT